MLKAIMRSVIMSVNSLGVIWLSVIMPFVSILSVIMLSAIAPGVIMLSAIVLSAIMLSAIMLSASRQSVIAPFYWGHHQFSIWLKYWFQFCFYFLLKKALKFCFAPSFGLKPLCRQAFGRLRHYKNEQKRC